MHNEAKYLSKYQFVKKMNHMAKITIDPEVYFQICPKCIRDIRMMK